MKIKLLLILLISSTAIVAMEENTNNSNNMEIDSNVNSKRKRDTHKVEDNLEKSAKRPKISENNLKNFKEVSSLKDLSAKAIADYIVEPKKYPNFKFNSKVLHRELMLDISNNIFKFHSNKAWQIGQINCIKYSTKFCSMSDDGTRISIQNSTDKNKNGLYLSASEKHLAHFFPTETENQLVNQAKISRNGEIIVIGYTTGVVKVCASNGETLHVLNLKQDSNNETIYPKNVTNLLISKNNKFLVAFYGNLLKIWDLTNGKEKHSFELSDHLILQVKLSKDDNFLLINNFDFTRIINTETGELQELQHQFSLNDDDIECLQTKLSPSNKYLVISYGEEQMFGKVFIQILDRENDSVIEIPGFDLLDICKEEKFLLLGEHRRMKRVQKNYFNNGNRYQIIDCIDEWEGDGIRDAKITKDNKYIISLTNEGILRILDFESAGFLKELQKNVDEFTFSKDSKLLITKNNAVNKIEIIFWDLETLQQLRTYTITNENPTTFFMTLTKSNRFLFLTGESSEYVLSVKKQNSAQAKLEKPQPTPEK